MRASRLVSMLLLLQTRGRLTAQELADELEVSVRTIYRDLEALGAAGVPVFAESGHHGGCQLIDGYRTRLTGLTTKEAQALFATGVPGAVGDLGLGTVLGAAQLKLLAALPKELTERLALARPRFHVDAPGWFQTSRNDPHLAEIAAAVWEDQRIEIRYRHPGDDAPVPRTLDPFGLVCKGGTWYLVARRDGELRTYRVSRVLEVSVLGDQFERPEDFDLARYWTESVAAFEANVPEVEIIVDASARGVDALANLVHSDRSALVARDEPDGGWTRCVLRFEDLDQAYADLIRLGADVVVIEPLTLRDQLVETAVAMRARYARVR